MQGNVNAFSFIVKRYKDMVYTVVYRIIRNNEDAEEIAQDVFLKAYQNLKQFREKSRFSTWLYRIAYNMAISKLRKRKVQTIDINAYGNEFVENENIPGLDDRISEKRQKEIIKTILEELPPEESTLITLYYNDNRNTEEISKITGLSISNVKVKLHRIRKKIGCRYNSMTKNNLEVRYNG
ncbi:MAG: RNA polymerase sigma factor [Desulfobacula sp.]|nr:RNA polymerase sigma factor [Desulfobacula sp.]